MYFHLKRPPSDKLHPKAKDNLNTKRTLVLSLTDMYFSVLYYL